MAPGPGGRVGVSSKGALQRLYFEIRREARPLRNGRSLPIVMVAWPGLNEEKPRPKRPHLGASTGAVEDSSPGHTTGRGLWESQTHGRIADGAGDGLGGADRAGGGEGARGTRLASARLRPGADAGRRRV